MWVKVDEYFAAVEERQANTAAAKYLRGDFSQPQEEPDRYEYCGICEHRVPSGDCPRTLVDKRRSCRECQATARRFYRARR